MKIGIDVSPLQSGHKVRGVGFYLTHLLNALKEYYPEHTYVEFTKENTPKDVDVIHYPYFDPFFLTFPLRNTRPTVLTIHDLTPLKFPRLFPSGKKGMLKWQIQKMIAKKADAIITDSESSKRDIKDILRIPDKKIHVAYLAAGQEFGKLKLEKKDVERLRKHHNLPDKFALYVGDVTPNKNLPVLIEAVEKAQVPLVLVGKALASSDFDKNHPWNKDLVRIQERVHNNPLFRVLGFVETEELVKLYNTCSVFVMPSFAEGFGLPLVEAMSCGAPVVTTDVSSLPEVGGDAPLYVDYRSPENFADAMRKIMNDRSLSENMSLKSLKQAEKFSWKKTAGETVTVDKSLVQL